MGFARLDKAEIERHLNRKNVEVLVFDTVTSTNDIVKKLILQGDRTDRREYLVAAEMQTAGRGRQGKSFYSPKGSGLYFTLAMTPKNSDFTLITSALATAVSKGIDKVCSVETQIKWVNDIYLGGRKICGILAELIGDAVVAGIGINITTEDFPEELRGRAGSLGGSIDRNVLAAEIADAAFELCGDLDGNAAEILAYCERRSCVIGRKIKFTDGGVAYRARAVALDGKGGLVVVTEEGERVLRGGEISVRSLGG